MYKTGEWLFDKFEKSLPYVEKLAPSVTPENIMPYGAYGPDPFIQQNDYLDKIF